MLDNDSKLSRRRGNSWKHGILGGTFLHTGNFRISLKIFYSLIGQFLHAHPTAILLLIIIRASLSALDGSDYFSASLTINIKTLLSMRWGIVTICTIHIIRAFFLVCIAMFTAVLYPAVLNPAFFSWWCLLQFSNRALYLVHTGRLFSIHVPCICISRFLFKHTTLLLKSFLDQLTNAIIHWAIWHMV